jgi:hypothetical protein
VERFLDSLEFRDVACPSSSGRYRMNEGRA